MGERDRETECVLFWVAVVVVVVLLMCVLHVPCLMLYIHYRCCHSILFFNVYVVVVVRSVLRVVVYVFVDRSEVLSCQVRV